MASLLRLIFNAFFRFRSEIFTVRVLDKFYTGKTGQRNSKFIFRSFRNKNWLNETFYGMVLGDGEFSTRKKIDKVWFSFQNIIQLYQKLSKGYSLSFNKKINQIIKKKTIFLLVLLHYYYYFLTCVLFSFWLFFIKKYTKFGYGIYMYESKKNS